MLALALGATPLRAEEPQLNERLKQPVVVANKPGAAGAVGNQFVATSKPDGYTLGVMDPNPVLQQLLGDPEVLLGAIQSPEQRALLPRLDALVATIIGSSMRSMTCGSGRAAGDSISYSSPVVFTTR